MDNNKICTVCRMKLDVVNYLKHRTFCRSCYNKIEENTIILHAITKNRNC